MVDVLRIVKPVPRDLYPPSTLTFGRRGADIELDPTDTTISRLAGSFSWSEPGWLVTNHSTSRPFHVIGSTGLRTTVPARERLLLGTGAASVLVPGRARIHEIRLAVDPGAAEAAANPEAAGNGRDDDATAVPLITPREREALVALATRYFASPPMHANQPLTYAEAAELTALPAATVRKRVERARERLSAAGVPGLEGADCRAAMCEFLIASGLISADDAVG